MSSQEPVIAVLNETSESEPFDSFAVPPSEDLVVKDTPTIVDSEPAEPATELPAKTVQTASDDTLATLLKHNTNIPDPTPTNLNSSVNEANDTFFVNEPDHTLVPVEIQKVDDANEVAQEAKAPIKDAANGDVEGDTSCMSQGADLDLADQTLVEGLSRDADTSVIQEVTDVPVKVFDADAEMKIVVEDDEDDRIPEPVAVPVNDVEEAMAPVPEVMVSFTFPVEETPVPAKPEPKVESKPEFVDTGLPIVEPVEVDPIDYEDAEPVVDLTKDEPVPSEEPVVEDEEAIEAVFDPSPISNEPAAEPAWLKPVEIIGDVPPVTEDAFPEEPGLVIADLNAAKEVEPHAAELEVAPEPIEIVTMTKEDPKHIPEESAKVAEPVVEVEDIPTAEPKEIAPPVTESTSEPVIEDLGGAKEVEEHAAKIEVAPVFGFNVEEEPVKDPVFEVTEFPPVPNEDAPLPATNGAGHPDEELAEPVKETSEVVVPEESTRSIPGISALGEVEPVIEEPEEARPPVQGEEVYFKVEHAPSTTETAEFEPTERADDPEPVEEVQVIEFENPEETLLEESPTPQPVPEPSNGVGEVPVEAEPVVATPLTFVVPEHVTEEVVTEETRAVDPVKDITPDVIAEETPIVDELEVSTPEPQEKIEESTFVVAAPAESPEPAPEVTEQEVPVFAVFEPTVEPAAEEGPVSDPLEPDVLASEPALGEAPPVESESVEEPQEFEAAQPPVSEEKPSIDEVEPEEAPPATFDPVDAAQDIPAPDVPQEETKQVESFWAPSYSVNFQGGSLDTTLPADEEVQSIPAPEPPVEESVAEFAPAPEIVTPAEEHAVVEPDITADDVQESPSWTPSYSITIQDTSSRFETRSTAENEAESVSAGPENAPTAIQKAEPELAIIEPVEESFSQVVPAAEEPTTVKLEEDVSETILSEPPTSGDVLATSQDAESVPAPAKPVAAEEVPEPTVTEDAKSADEVPPIDAPSEQPSDVFDTLLDETPVAEVETEVPPMEEVEAAGTPKIVTPADEEPVESAVTTETPWTRSYSVTSQPGSPRISPKAETKELEPEPYPIESIQETHVAPPVFELADVPMTVVTHVEDEDEGVTEPAPEEESKLAWTQSYSVTSQPGSPRVSPKQVPEEIPEVEEVEPSWTRSYSVTSQPGSPRILLKEDLPELTLEPAAVAEEPATVVTPPVEEAVPAETEAPERPKSPWTPSYSVTTLPGSAPVEESEPHPVTIKPLVDVEVLPLEQVEAVKTVEDPKESGAISDVFEVHEAVVQFPVHDEPQVDVKITEPAPPQLDLPKPDVTGEGEEELSWTPSYSVTHLPGASPKVETKEEPMASPDIQTMDEPTTREVESTLSRDPHTQGLTTNGTTTEAKDDGPHYFPRVPESLDEAAEKPKLDLFISADPSGVSKVSPRTRYASSTSSRLFPGAWLSSPRSPGDETRTSMEEAIGEFVLSKSSVAPNEPAVAEAPEDAPASPITPATPTTKKDKKWRMCEIM